MVSRFNVLPVALVAIASLMFLFNLGGTRLWDDDEPKNAGCGREMLQRGDWLVPTFNDELRSHKPVLLYWAMSASYKLTGFTEFGARLPSAIAGIGTVLLCFLLGRKLYDPSVGFSAGILLASGLMFAVLSRAATPDAILIFWSTASLFCFVHGMSALRGGQFSGNAPQQQPSLEMDLLPIWAAAGMYICMGLAVLTKGPIGVLLPMSVVGLYSIFFGSEIPQTTADGETTRWRRCWQYFAILVAPTRLLRISRGLRMWSGAAIVATVALPWYVAVTITTEGEWLTGFIGTHNVHRFLHPMEGHSGPIFYYLIAILAGFFPGSCFLPVAVARAVKDQRRRSRWAHSHAFLLTWVGCYLTFFSLAATKLPNYIVPCYPALALLTGYWLVTALGEAAPPRLSLRIGMASLALVGLALTIGLGTAAVLYLDADMLVAVAGLVPLVGGVLGLMCLRKQQDQYALASFAATCVLFTVCATGITASRVSPYQTSPRIAKHLKQIEATTGSESVQIATYRYTKPNLVFYSDKPVPGLGSDDEAVELLKSNQDSYVVLPEKIYAKLSQRLPSDIGVIHSEPRFFKPNEQIVIVGRQIRLSQRNTSGSSSTK